MRRTTTGSAPVPRTRPVTVLASPRDTGTDGNPYIELLFGGVRDAGIEVLGFDRRRLLAAPDVVHVHWPAALVRWDRLPRAVLDVSKVLGGLLVARARGSRLVWTGHDLEPHELRRPRLHRAYFALFSRLIDTWISLTPAGVDLLRARHPALRRRPVRVIPHGSYRPVHPETATRIEAQRVLGLPVDAQPTFLLLGQLRRYKNALPLIDAFTASGIRGRLLVVGEVRGDTELEHELRRAADGRPEVVLRIGRVPSAEIPLWHGAADVVVLPYDSRSTLNSGALMLALSLGTPVVVGDSTINRELRDGVGAEWVHLFSGDAQEALRVAAAAMRVPRSASPDLDAFAWPGIVASTVELYRDLADG